MRYYLEHYFDPDFNHQALRPLEDGSGKSDLHNMGYAQNVSSGQILAEIKSLDLARDVDGRFVLEEPVFPAGPNTRVDPAWPQYLLSTVNGYVFYHNQLISVKKQLNVRGGVNFHTGNITFINDVSVCGDVKAGFVLQGNNVLLEGMVEGGIVRSRKDMIIHGGARGGPSNRCLISAGASLNLQFGEKAEIRARGRMVIRTFAAHCDIFSQGPLVVHERLLGGLCQGLTLLYVKELGSMGGAETRIHMGYDPLAHRRLERVEFEISDLETKANHYAAVTRNAGPDKDDLRKKLDQTTRKMVVMQRVRSELQDKLERDELYLKHCRVVVTGTVHPGVIISIGQATRYIEDPMNDVCFFYAEGEVCVRPNPKAGGGTTADAGRSHSEPVATGELA